ncbi:MAG TPA: hypothetical protein VGM88_03775 [Kofleriaceae bacterium]
MKGAVLVLALAACSAGDDTVAGTRGQCAEGGALEDCPAAEQTAEGACWRLVDCGAIPLDSDDPNATYIFDWGKCVDGIDGLTADRQRLVIDCIAASACDALRVQGSPTNPNTGQMQCIRIGDQ